MRTTSMGRKCSDEKKEEFSVFTQTSLNMFLKYASLAFFDTLHVYMHIDTDIGDEVKTNMRKKTCSQ